MTLAHPPLTAARVETLDLEVLHYNTAHFLSRELMVDGPAVEFVMRELPEMMGRQFAAMLKVPGQVLQENRVIHRHPATLWDHIKQRTVAHIPALKRWLSVRYLEVKLTEHLVYPTVRVPDEYSRRVRLYVVPSFDTFIQSAR